MDRATRALNLWDIENRIRTTQKELEALHEMKDDLLDGNDLYKGNQITCE